MHARADATLTCVTIAEVHADRIALLGEDERVAYRDLLDRSAAWATTLLNGEDDLREARIAFLVDPTPEYVAVQWGIWRAGGVAVPLAVSHPARELRQTIVDARPRWVVADPQLADRLTGLPPEVKVMSTRDVMTPSRDATDLPRVSPTRRALIVYTSGTTGEPKGAVLTHANIDAQVASLQTAWGWTPDDRIVLPLPLHHVHGMINVLAGALWSGASCDMLVRFDPVAVWERFAAGACTVFMAVPTVYARLIEAWSHAPETDRRRWSAGAGRCRLMVSGSAALPVTVLEQWRDLTGHTLLERYGMTEIGMALSNPLEGERRPGTVGVPLPGVEVRRRTDEGHAPPPDEPAELLIRGPNVIAEYWERPEETARAFSDGWFCTGDVAVIEDGYYRLLGRQSVDIIKTGGYKVSALEIEEALRACPGVRECAVVGVPDETWGERICAAVVTSEPELSLEDVLRHARERLAPYKLPRALQVVDTLPRNAMGKVTKPDVARFFPPSTS